MSNVLKVCPEGAQLFHADGWASRQTKQIWRS